MKKKIARNNMPFQSLIKNDGDKRNVIDTHKITRKENVYFIYNIKLPFLGATANSSKIPSMYQY
jgi:hypothetical protein